MSFYHFIFIHIDFNRSYTIHSSYLNQVLRLKIFYIHIPIFFLIFYILKTSDHKKYDHYSYLSTPKTFEKNINSFNQFEDITF